MVDTVLHFGRYTGVGLDKIPIPYLRWVIKNVDLDYKYPGLKKQIKNFIRNGGQCSTSRARLAPETKQAISAGRVELLSSSSRELLDTASQSEPRESNSRVSDSVHIKVAGTSYHQLAVKVSIVGDPVKLEADPNNPHDPCAIRLINCRLEASSGDGWIGFIPSKHSCLLSQAMIKGHRFDATISRVSGSSIVGATISLKLVTRVGASPRPASNWP